MPYSFKGGVHPPENKKRSAFKPSEILAAPERLYFPMQMHVGAPCAPTVKKGDNVCVGQVIGFSDAPISALIHSSVSGTVADIKEWDHPSGRKVMTVIIENDNKFTVAPEVLEREAKAKEKDPLDRTPEEVIEAIRLAGIVGMGGAGFPTAFKIRSVLGQIHTLIINAAECEPYITADNRLLVERMDDALLGIRILMKTLGVSHATLAIESNKEEAIEMLRERLDGTGIMLRILRTKYPQGSEKHIIRAVTGREVPPGKLPGDIGCAVFNPASCAAIYDAVAKGLPLISRFVTISGSAIGNPQNLQVRIGTPISCLISAAGGYSLPPQRILIGRPIMGTAQYTTEVPVLKTCNSVLVFGENEGLHAGSAICIRCGKCVSVCPMRLQPLYIRLYGEKGEYEYCEKKLNVRDCIECGACSYKCPGHLPLVQSIRFVKQRLGPVKKS